MIEVAGFVVSVFVPLLKGRFFGVYYRYITLADGMGYKLQSPVFYAIIPQTKARKIP